MFGAIKGKKMKELTEDYFAIVNRCADNEENFPIPNRDAKHASFILETLFRKATSEVCIFTGRLFADVFGAQALIGKAINFLNEKPKAKLKIIYQDSLTREQILENNFIQKIVDSIGLDSEKLEIYKTGAKHSSLVNHFCVMDKKAFRYELDHETREATANFGDTETAQKLSDIFEAIITGSEKLALQS